MNKIFYSILVSLIILLLGNVHAEEHTQDAFRVKEVKEKDQNISFSDLFRTRRDEAYVGVILANFLYIDPKNRFIYVKPQEGDLPRITIYLDKYTAYSTMKVGKLGKAKKQMMLEGDRVALRVFVKNGIVLADEVFLVEGDFGPKARFAKRKYTRTPVAAGAKKEGEKEKKAEGHH